jgi:branched-chain amino acid transport system substrate-binding protein
VRLNSIKTPRSLGKEKKLNKNLLFIPLALLLAISLIAIGCPAEETTTPPTTTTPTTTAPTTTTEPPVKQLEIGVLVATTGWFSSAGLLDQEECGVVTDMLKDAGGITVDGQRYEIVPVFEDVKSTHEGVIAATNKLIYDRGVKFIVGPNAFWASASGPLCEENKIFNAIGFCTNTPGELDASTQYRVLAYNSTMGNITGLIEYISTAHPEVKSVVALNPEDGSDIYLQPLFKKALEDKGITMVGDLVGYSLELVDFTPIAQKIGQMDADAIFVPNGLDFHIASLLKGMREQGDERWVFYSSVALVSKLKELAGPAGYKVTSGTALPGNPGNAASLDEFINRYYEKSGEVRSIILQSSGALYVLAQLIEQAQSLDPTEVRDALQNMTDVPTVWGPGHLCGEETYGIRNHAVCHPYSLQYLDENGEIQFGGWFEVHVP